MKIAILGAGFCGIAAAWHLLQFKSPDLPLEVVVFDPVGIGGGTSGIAAGLMHPYVGAHAKLNWNGIQGLHSTCQLLEIATKALDQPVAAYSGMLRIALTQAQQQDFRLCAQQHADVQSQTVQQCQQRAPGVAPREGIFIQSAVSVDSFLYLKGLWKACTALGAAFEKRAVHTLEELAHFDRIIVAMGSATSSLPELAHLPLRPVKGQVLELALPTGMALPTLPINSQAYLVKNFGNDHYTVGATFEKHFETGQPDIDFAKKEILPKAYAMLPPLAESTIAGCRAGIRVSTSTRRPMAARLNSRCWVLTGMGSKGLLYHSLLANQVASDIVLTRK